MTARPPEGARSLDVACDGAPHGVPGAARNARTAPSRSTLALSAPLRALALAAAIMIGAPSASPAQAPDCTGISDVSDFDGAVVSDLDGLLSSVPVPITLTRPLYVTAPPGDVHRIFIVEQDGTIRIVKDGAALATPFLNVSGLTRSPADIGGGDEEGLLGLAFHPDYATNGWFFVYHTNTTGSANLLARYTVSAADPDLADGASRIEVASYAHPTFGNHNGGQLAFGPADGYLYIGTGDGGSTCDPNSNAQNLSIHLGKILRIDVDSLPFTIPPTNPFAGPVAGNDDIWAYGLRNPWRLSFDRENATLFIGDVGQSQIEEIDCRAASSTGGENYGWDRYEGDTCPNPSCGSQGSCAFPNVLPVQQYTHTNPSGSCAVTGGYVYRGCRMGDLRGHYFYADYCSAIVRSFRTDAACAAPAPISRRTDLAPENGATLSLLTSFGEDARGEIYIVSRGNGVFKIVPTLGIVEVSGRNAAPFTAGSTDWTWEDVAATDRRPIASYKVYRAPAPTGTFECVHQSATSAWAGGDPDDPAAGDAFYYLVTAVNPLGEETRPGNRSNGTPRVVDTASICPA